jgi:hypothetical protein
MLKSSYENMEIFVEKYLDTLKDKKLKILDIGSQDVNGSYKKIFDNPNWDYYGCDMAAGKNVDIILEDVYNWKSIKSESFDVVISDKHLNI